MHTIATKLTSFITSAPFIASLLFLTLQLPTHNLGLSFRDEGLNFYYSQEILKGHIPYRDFFMVLNPGSYYLQALVMKLFGNYFILGRYLYILWALLLIWLAPLLFPIRNRFFSYLMLLGLSAILYWPGGFGTYNIESVGMMLMALLLIKLGCEKQHLFLLGAGLATGGMFFSKQTIGITAIPALYLALVLYAPKRDVARYLRSFTTGLLIFFLSFFIYLYLNQALLPYFSSVFLFGAQVKSHQHKFMLMSVLSFPLLLILGTVVQFYHQKTKALLLHTLLLIVCGLVALATFYPEKLLKYLGSSLYPSLGVLLFLPPLSLSYILVTYLRKNPRAISKATILKHILSHKTIVSMNILLLGGYYGLASSGKTLEVARMLSVLALPLILVSLDQYKRLTKNQYYFTGTALILLYVTLTAYNPLTLNLKIFGVYPAKLMTQNASFQEGRELKISPSIDRDLGAAITFTKTHVAPHEKIMCFPYCAIMFSLTSRENSSYDNFYYHEFFMPSNQFKAIAEIERTKPAMIIMQRPGEIEMEADYEDVRLPILVTYIRAHYMLVEQTANFSFYIPASSHEFAIL